MSSTSDGSWSDGPCSDDSWTALSSPEPVDAAFSSSEDGAAASSVPTAPVSSPVSRMGRTTWRYPSALTTRTGVPSSIHSDWDTISTRSSRKIPTPEGRRSVAATPSAPMRSVLRSADSYPMARSVRVPRKIPDWNRRVLLGRCRRRAHPVTSRINSVVPSTAPAR